MKKFSFVRDLLYNNAYNHKIGRKRMDKYLKIKSLFEKSQDEENAKKMAQYMKNQFLFYGIATPKRRAIYKEFLKQEKKQHKVDWEFLDLCYQDEHREFQYLVYDYLLSLKKDLVFDDIKKIKTYIQMKSWWDTIDFFDKVLCTIGLQDQRVDDLMLEWSLDSDIWLRRIAIDYQLGRKEKTKEDLLEKIIVNNLGSDEFFINKAIGWSLRDYSKTNPQWVKNFINKYHDQMSRLSIKEGSKYL